MIWYQHVYNIFMLSFHVLTHKKKSQRAKERCSHLILEIKICIWDQPTPLPSRKALQQLRCTLDSAHPETSLELIWSKLAADLRHPLHSHFTQLWNFITSDSEDDAFFFFLRLSGGKCRIHQILNVIFVRGIIWPRALITEGRNWLQVMH